MRQLRTTGVSSGRRASAPDDVRQLRTTCVSSTMSRMSWVRYLTLDELHAGLDLIRASPSDTGVLEMIVRRPDEGEREVLEQGELDFVYGLVGDTWLARGSGRTSDGTSHPDMQLNVMNSRAVALMAQHRDRWALAGDQLYIDLDLSEGNAPAGTQLAIGDAVIEITPQPHTGCAKFVSRFGLDATKFVNSPVGRELHLRGVNARVVVPGEIRVGDVVRKIRSSESAPAA